MQKGWFFTWFFNEWMGEMYVSTCVKIVWYIVVPCKFRWTHHHCHGDVCERVHGCVFFPEKKRRYSSDFITTYRFSNWRVYLKLLCCFKQKLLFKSSSVEYVETSVVFVGSAPIKWISWNVFCVKKLQLCVASADLSAGICVMCCASGVATINHFPPGCSL